MVLIGVCALGTQGGFAQTISCDGFPSMGVYCLNDPVLFNCSTSATDATGASLEIKDVNTNAKLEFDVDNNRKNDSKGNQQSGINGTLTWIDNQGMQFSGLFSNAKSQGNPLKFQVEFYKVVNQGNSSSRHAVIDLDRTLTVANLPAFQFYNATLVSRVEKEADPKLPDFPNPNNLTEPYLLLRYGAIALGFSVPLLTVVAIAGGYLSWKWWKGKPESPNTKGTLDSDDNIPGSRKDFPVYDMLPDASSSGIVLRGSPLDSEVRTRFLQDACWPQLVFCTEGDACSEPPENQYNLARLDYGTPPDPVYETIADGEQEVIYETVAQTSPPASEQDSEQGCYDSFESGEEDSESDDSGATRYTVKPASEILEALVNRVSSTAPVPVFHQTESADNVHEKYWESKSHLSKPCRKEPVSREQRTDAQVEHNYVLLEEPSSGGRFPEVAPCIIVWLVTPVFDSTQTPHERESLYDQVPATRDAGLQVSKHVLRNLDFAAVMMGEYAQPDEADPDNVPKHEISKPDESTCSQRQQPPKLPFEKKPPCPGL